MTQAERQKLYEDAQQAWLDRHRPDFIECPYCDGTGGGLAEDEDSDGRKCFLVVQCGTCLGLGEVERSAVE